MPIRGSPNRAAVLVHAIHTPDAMVRNRWTSSTGMGGGRHVPESAVAINRCAHYPSLHLNLARDYWRLGRAIDARQHLLEASEWLRKTGGFTQDGSRYRVWPVSPRRHNAISHRS